MKDYYYILGVNEAATAIEIRKAYRELSKKFHPDVNKGSQYFEDLFKSINEAYEVIGNEHSRKRYDEFRKNSIQSNSDVDYDYNDTPEIVEFSTNKDAIYQNEEIIIQWNVIYADEITITSLGEVQQRGFKKLKFSKLINQRHATLRLTAKNSSSGKVDFREIIIRNSAYSEAKIDSQIYSKKETKAEQNIKIIYAKLWRRVIAELIDLIIFMVMAD